MSEYTAELTWQRGDAAFVDNRYSRRHVLRFDGGLEVPASSAPSSVPVPMSDPAAADPEELLVAALSSCHMLWFLALAARKKFRVDGYVDHAIGSMHKNAQGKVAMTRVVLKPEVHFSGEHLPTRADLDALHHEAHELCYIANSVKADVVCEPVYAEGGAQ